MIPGEYSLFLVFVRRCVEEVAMNSSSLSPWEFGGNLKEGGDKFEVARRWPCCEVGGGGNLNSDCSVVVFELASG